MNEWMSCLKVRASALFSISIEVNVSVYTTQWHAGDLGHSWTSGIFKSLCDLGEGISPWESVTWQMRTEKKNRSLGTDSLNGWRNSWRKVDQKWEEKTGLRGEGKFLKGNDAPLCPERQQGQREAQSSVNCANTYEGAIHLSTQFYYSCITPVSLFSVPISG